MYDEKCSIIRDLSTNVEYHIVMAVKGILCFAGAMRMLKQWREYGVRFVGHDNTKILFRFYYALSILQVILFGTVYIFELIRIRYECFLLDFRYIILTRCIGIATILSAHHIILIMSCERLYSSIFPAYFERNSSKSLAISIALTMISLTYVYSMMKLTDSFELFRGILIALPNELLPHNMDGFMTLMSVSAISNCLSFAISCFDLFLNLHLKNANNVSISVTYQLAENRRVILMSLPIELTETMIILFSATAQIAYKKFVTNPTPIERQIFLELSTPSVILPLIITFIIKYNVEKKAKKMHRVEPVVDHFEFLQNIWNE